MPLCVKFTAKPLSQSSANRFLARTGIHVLNPAGSFSVVQCCMIATVSQQSSKCSMAPSSFQLRYTSVAFFFVQSKSRFLPWLHRDTVLVLEHHHFHPRLPQAGWPGLACASQHIPLNVANEPQQNEQLCLQLPLPTHVYENTQQLASRKTWRVAWKKCWISLYHPFCAVGSKSLSLHSLTLQAQQERRLIFLYLLQTIVSSSSIDM